MRELAQIALYAWLPFVLLVFAVMRPRRAVIFSYIGGWLILPMLAIDFAGFPDLTKITASSLGVLLGAAVFDSKTLFKFRPGVYDLPMAVWCLSPFVTSIVNGLGAYDGASNIVSQLAVWGIPYVIGRVYFNDLQGFKELGLGIIIGALVYLPLCYLEMVISPQLHKLTYGFYQHTIAQTKRWGSFRPMVFMQSSLALAMYMTTAALVAGWMWASGTQKKLFGVPMLWVAGVLFVTQILCKTMAATAFMFMGFAALYWIKWLGRSGGLIAGLPILLLVAVPPLYMYARSNELISREQIVEAMSTITSAERLQSLDIRLKAEDTVIGLVLLVPDPWWGRGKWDPNDPARTPWRAYVEYEKQGIDGMPVRVIRDVAPTDGLWIITLGQYGLVGVIALTITIMLPAFVFWKRVPLRFWGHPAVATAAAMAFLLILHMVDNLLNGMINSIYMLALGGLAGIGPAIRKISRRYGPAAASAVLDQQVTSSAAAGPHGLPVQAIPGYGPAGAALPGMMPMSGYGVARGYAPSVQAGYPFVQHPEPGSVPGFPSLAGLQAQPVRHPRRKR